ncbi:hypothetical protein [Alcaligenes sp. SORT26]|uniref:hypothetical protein n=1 Tax=Alcaligenes sp. SORT26 TaxID=2813780 RepID=UPI001FB01755|nr:hypothetical protein [Alcaligenes sp. SORT26]
MQRALSLDQSPSLSLTLPLFANVPFFGLLAATLAFYSGPELFNSRWHPATLALTHAWTLGIVGSAMFASLAHILAVACNVRIQVSRRRALSFWSLFSAGTLLLINGFISWQSWAYKLAGLCLVLSLGGYLLTVMLALWRSRRDVFRGAKEIVAPIRLALLGLLLTVSTGLAMLIALATDQAIPNLLNLHMMMGLAAWAGLLLIAMSFQLLPIFQITELYPAPLVRWLPWGIGALLIAQWTLAPLPGSWLPVRDLVTYLIFLAYGLWAVVSWARLWKRKRPTKGASTLFWYSSLSSLLLAVILNFWAHTPSGSNSELAIGVLLIMGALGSVVCGMLYTIVPFLLWREAQEHVSMDTDNTEHTRALLRLIPKTANYIPASTARVHWALHSLSILVWTGASLGIEFLAWIAAPALLLSFAILAWNLWTAWQRYRLSLSAMRAYQAEHHIDAKPHCLKS